MLEQSLQGSVAQPEKLCLPPTQPATCLHRQRPFRIFRWPPLSSTGVSCLVLCRMWIQRNQHHSVKAIGQFTITPNVLERLIGSELQLHKLQLPVAVHIHETHLKALPRIQLNREARLRSGGFRPVAQHCSTATLCTDLSSQQADQQRNPL